ncbi:hypothetical protein [Fibrivirga algicola]|uniref:MxaA protein n=1 Tax=Fibrivirga algicola TaxID=2950420 RepID=A0ABX0QL78_9BACT|nr:hypothetical protein [Fibrivirga algicola]ARK11558.1 hypothetical protein A6C57_15175 [Fibrella sp. ES10-3-2-2]NID12578.1 hypothetical protein [Fibrivirga algicola]
MRYLLFFFALLCLPALAQPVGQFIDDTIEVGRPFRYALTVKHRASQDVFYPDTARHFAPFLVQSVAIFPTKTVNKISLDSAVYTLVSFEVSRARVLQVPVYMANGADCTALLSSPDTVFLRSRVLATTRPDTLQLAANAILTPLPQEFNYAYLTVAVGLMGVVAAAIYILFGSLLRQRWERYLLTRDHTRFLRMYNQLTRNLGPESTGDTTNQAIVNWKKYLELLEKKPYTSLTSSEIADRIGDDRLTDALRETDRMIYGGSFTDQSPLALRVLRDVAVTAYQRRREAIS